MKTTKLSLLIVSLLGFTLTAGAQNSDLTITGSVRPRVQVNLEDGTGYANLSSGPGGSTFIRFSYKLSPFSSLVLRFGAPYLDSRSGTAYDSTKTSTGSDIAVNSWLSGVGIQEAYGVTDILGEMKMDSVLGLKLQAGMYKLKAPVFSRGLNFGFGTGDDYSRSEVFVGYTFPYPGASYESYKWNVEIPVNALKEVFPLNLRVGSDLDLTGKFQKTGFTGYADLGGRNLYLVNDLFVVDWNLNYTYKVRDAAPAGTPYVAGAQMFGGALGIGFGFENGLSVGIGGAADLASYSYKARWAGTATLRDYSERRLNYQAGLDLTMKSWAKLSGAYVHRNKFDVDVGTVTDPKTPVDYAQNYAAFRLDWLSIPSLTPYFGGTYVLGYETVMDTLINRIRTTPENTDKLAWEAGLMWDLTRNIELDCGYTQGANNALTNYGAVLNAIEQSKKGAVFFRAGWKF